MYVPRGKDWKEVESIEVHSSLYKWPLVRRSRSEVIHLSLDVLERVEGTFHFSMWSQVYTVVLRNQLHKRRRYTERGCPETAYRYRLCTMHTAMTLDLPNLCHQ